MPDEPTSHASRVLTILPIDDPGDRRVPLTPEHAKGLIGDGWTVRVARDLSTTPGFTDDAYAAVGAKIVEPDAPPADGVAVCLHPPKPEIAARLMPETVLVGFLDPFNQTPLIADLASRSVPALALELVPRTTIAQPMDALSSQASLAGYAAVLAAADQLPKALPMMSTAAGTIRPAKVFILGAGVAGLQAIATAGRLGARVTAYDIRPAAQEQITSLGAKVAKIDQGTGDAEAAGGYAKELTPDQIAAQQRAMAAYCAESDIVITTAQVFGRKAPVLLTRSMVEGMKPGSVVVDMAIATGGNVEGAEPGRVVDINGVKVIGDPHLPSRVAHDASQVLGANILALLRHTLEEGKAVLKPHDDDPVLSAVLLTHAGQIRDERVREHVQNDQGARS
jgi:NAD(P) transhydrogenase subunit alpha